MPVFDLERFRDLAFGGGSRPDHPLGTVAEAEALLADLNPGDPAATLADLTAWTKSMNENDSFTPVRRVRILLMLDDATQPIWRALDVEYLAPGGRPLARDGDVNILRAMFDSASEFTNGFGIALDAAGEDQSVWLERNVSRIYVRNMRWLARRLVLAHMLHLGVAGALWERMHRLYRLAEERKVSRAVLPVFRSKRPTSVRHEYIRALLLDLAGPDAMPGRQVELAFRVTPRPPLSRSYRSAMLARFRPPCSGATSFRRRSISTLRSPCRGCAPASSATWGATRPRRTRSTTASSRSASASR
jgi:hypothetical protein